MNTASILVKTAPEVKEKAQKIAEEMGLSLTSVINRYLKHFITAKTITFSIDEENPSEFFLHSLRESEKDIKAGRTMSFKTGTEALSFLDKEITNDKQNQKSSY